ncbi:MAG: MmgE/PrpD family protein [Burkholderiales bacterium]
MSGGGTGLSSALAAHAASVRIGSLPDAVVEATRTSILDQCGVILAASGLAAPCAPFVRIAREGAAGRAAVIGHGLRSTAELAAFANGAMAHALDFEDTHDATLVHPHAAVLPAALAVAQARGASGAELLAAVAAGADVACRIALAFEDSPEDPDGFTDVPLIGAYGATAAVGRLLGASPERIEQALSLVLGMVAGSAAAQRDPGSHWRAVRDAFNARAAVTAATLAQLGVEGFRQPLEGRAGYYALYARRGWSAEAALRGLGERFEGAAVSFKPWPSCRGTHAFVEAALALVAAHPLRPEDVRAIHVRVSPFFRTLCEPQALRARPGTATDATFSSPFTVGIALAKGRVVLEDFADDALHDARVRAIAAATRFEVCGAWRGDASTRGALRIELADGRTLAHEVVAPLGHPSNPMPADVLRRKFRDCAAHAAEPMPAERIERIAARIDALETQPDVVDLFD